MSTRTCFCDWWSGALCPACEDILTAELPVADAGTSNEEERRG